MPASPSEIQVFFTHLTRQLLAILMLDNCEEAFEFEYASDAQIANEVDMNQFVSRFWIVEILERLSQIERSVDKMGARKDTGTLPQHLHNLQIVSIGVHVFNAWFNPYFMEQLGIEMNMDVMSGVVQRIVDLQHRLQ